MARTVPPYKQLLSRKAVFQATAEYDRLGEPAFLARYGFGEADSYVMRAGSGAYASKAIVGVAYGYQYPDRGGLKSEAFSGGKTAAARHLSRLGFDVDGVDRNPEDWTLEEVQTAVSYYFGIYRTQADGAYSRARDFAAALAAIPMRNESAVSRKFSNISAILAEADLPTARGFSPLGNKQTLLSAIVYDWLQEHPDLFDHSPSESPGAREYALDVEVIPPAPTGVARTNRERRAARVDFAQRDESNRRLGRAGECWAVDFLRHELAWAGRPDLAQQVTWVSDVLGDGLGYDIATFGLDGQPQKVEVKTTNGSLAAPFVVTANEIRASEEEAGFVLMRVFNFSTHPRFYRLPGSLMITCSLTPTIFIAGPKERAA